ncbi:hypothetical protein RT41_GL000850 [Lactococcus fujiensis JCM 16395]|uniref:Uncharacterized protein n=1 Tax=Lactococcus fujiensis JCM 16395 TaxID=1291764 RepID=A0A2A5RNY3_9LACT|nr:hypothetical protein RT41_GL000850 [Lactococcus fujiensis JCM 16395]
MKGKWKQFSFAKNLPNYLVGFLYISQFDSLNWTILSEWIYGLSDLSISRAVAQSLLH